MINITKNNLYKDWLNNLLLDKEFIKKINTEKKQVIHDDLHPYNILFDKNNIVFLDFQGLKKYPKSLQIASFITNFYLYEGDTYKIDFLLKELNVDSNREYIIKLIIYRIIKTLIYFEKQLEIEENINVKNKETKLYQSLMYALNINNNERKDYGIKRLL